MLMLLMRMMLMMKTMMMLAVRSTPNQPWHPAVSILPCVLRTLEQAERLVFLRRSLARAPRQTWTCSYSSSPLRGHVTPR